MLDQINIENVLFLDIETVPMFPLFEDMSEKLQKLWDKKSIYFRNEEQSAADVYERAGIYAEFGKIVCISVGTVYQKQGKKKFRVKSYTSDEEKKLL